MTSTSSSSTVPRGAGVPPGTAPLGTVAWARAGGGRLSRREQLRELAAAGLLLLRTTPAQVRMRLGLPDPRAFSFDLDRIPLPDSAIARAAEEECRDCSPERLVNHCLRTYAWGTLLGARDGLRPDPELLWVAAMLHDLALTDAHRHASAMPCFGARAGLLAIDWAGERGWPRERCETLGDAISLHLNVRVAAVHGREAQLLQAGAALDVIGQRCWQLSPATTAAVLARHPRLDWFDGLGDFAAEAHPATRTHLLMRWLRFGTLMRHSPLRDG
jgi:HD domain